MYRAKVLGGGGPLSSGKGSISTLGIHGDVGSLADISSEDNQVEVLLDVVHDLSLEESLCGVVHDFVAELGFSDVLPGLLDTGSSSFGRAIFVNDLIALSLGALAIRKNGAQLLDDLKFSSEQGVFAWVHLVPVHLEELKVDSGNGLNQSFEASSELELSEKAGNDASGGGAGKTNLTVDDDGGVDGSSLEGVADGVEVSFVRGGRVAYGNSVVGEAGIGFLHFLNNVVKGHHFLDFNLMLLLADVDILELAVGLPSIEHLGKFFLVLLDAVSGDISELSVFANLVGGPSTDGVAVDVDDWLPC